MRISLLLIVVAAFVGVRTVLAVHKDGDFELDGNVADAADPANCDFPAPAGCGDDWSNIALNSSSANASTGIVSDPQVPTDTSIFTTGGSKDDLDVSSWRWTSGSVPDKDEILDAYAARYQNNIYFGADRYITNGTAQIGFWFFQNPVSPNANGTFDGLHEDGDILILADFTNGGAAVKVQIFQWELGGPINGTLRRLRGQEGGIPADCRDPALGDSDEFCATTNPTAVSTAGLWPYQAKQGPANNIPIGGFFEGGIDLAALGLADQCFSSFLAETRSSASVDATLKDHVLHTFQPCESGLVTTPLDASDNNISQGSVSIGGGRITVKDSAQLTVDGLGTWSGTISFHLCGPTALDQPYQLCETGGVAVVTNQAVNQSTTQPIVATTTVSSAGKYCWRGFFDSATDGLDDATDASINECFTVTPVQPSFSTTATTSVVLGNPISDTAHLGLTATQPGSPIIGGPAGAAAGGSITFNVYGPNDTNCSGASKFTATVPVSGNGDYGSGNFTPTLPGVYRWVASYSGNLPNTLSATGACNDSNEATLVTDTTSASSEQDWLPNDTATITSTGGSSLSGTITFQLYNGATCGGDGGTPVSGQFYERSFSNAGSSVTRSTSNTTFLVKTTTVYSWKVIFTPADGSNVSGSNHCQTTSLTINNNNGT